MLMLPLNVETLDTTIAVLVLVASVPVLAISPENAETDCADMPMPVRPPSIPPLPVMVPELVIPPAKVELLNSETPAPPEIVPLLVIPPEKVDTAKVRVPKPEPRKMPATPAVIDPLLVMPPEKTERPPLIESALPASWMPLPLEVIVPGLALLMPPTIEALETTKIAALLVGAPIVPLLVKPPTSVPWVSSTAVLNGEAWIFPLLMTLPTTLTEDDETTTLVNVPLMTTGSVEADELI